MVSKNRGIVALACLAGIALAGCLPQETGLSPNAPPTSPGNTNSAPTISGQPSSQAIAGTMWSFQPTADDADGDSLIFSASGLPAWALINPQTGLVYGVPTTVGTTTSIVVRVSDGEASASLPAFRITVAEGGPSPTPPNGPPSLSGTPANAVAVGSTYSFTPVASDPNNDTLAFSISAGSKPSWATFSTATGTLTGTPTAGHVGNYANIVISASDGTTTVSLPAFSITVNSGPSAALGNATLRWVAPTENADGSPLPALSLAGYRIYHGTSPDALNDIRSVSGAANTIFTFEQLPAGTHYFAVTALTLLGIESDRSAPGMKTIN